ncbi:MAG: RMD1 family protein [Sedimentibacter sp.]|uniref:RMD1 family protein n=1 Tax=Sedimentibacter sp. TaxID=1960295 RepID=UPI002980F96F|nr:RMD1 family protein [Sedimentibacter sp.]MDW5300259.1 RMD1 family protein [Sedimentibacter sp.]
MEKIIFYTYKAATKLPLAQIASFFNIKQDAVWKEYIKIESTEIEKILKYNSEKKSVYLYKFGCITFLNFKQNEIYIFLEYLKKLFVELDNKLLSQFNETHVMAVSSDGYVYLWEDDDAKYQYNKNIDDLVATILAKSTELYKIETELSGVLDEAGKFLMYLNKGYLRANTRKVISTIAKCIRFKYRSIESVRLLGRPSEFNRTIESRQIFDKFSNFFELDERYVVLANRMDILDSITGEYFSFRSKQSSRRLVLFEILLLSLFPLFYIIS